MKRIVFSLIAVLILAACVFADFRKDEDPAWAILTDTAYTLRGGEWNIDLGGAVSYGIIDGLHAQTNLILWAMQFPNIQVKWNFLPDGPSMPAISAGGTFAMATQKSGSDSVTEIIWNLSGYISKKLGDSLWINGSYTYNKFSATYTGSGGSYSLNDWLKTATGSSDPGGLSNAALSVIYQLSPGARLELETFALLSSSVYFAIVPGVNWAFGDNFRLKLFVFTYMGGTPIYVPMINLAWKIK